MENILILGDSFADATSCWPHRFSDVGPGWTELLAQHDSYNITNLAVGGSSFYYSYKNFIENHSNFDRVVFLVTHPGRISLDIPNLTNYSSARHHSGLDSLSSLKKLANYDKIALDYINALEDYFLYIQNHDYDVYCQWTFIEHIQRLKPNTILIPCFNNSLPNILGDPMSEIGHKEIASVFNIEFTHSIFKNLANQGLNDARKCHMCEENNYIFYLEVLKWMNGEPVSIDLSVYKEPTKDVSHYWRLY